MIVHNLINMYKLNASHKICDKVYADGYIGLFISSGASLKQRTNTWLSDETDSSYLF